MIYILIKYRFKMSKIYIVYLYKYKIKNFIKFINYLALLNMFQIII